jgi:hypothetical protein
MTGLFSSCHIQKFDKYFKILIRVLKNNTIMCSISASINVKLYLKHKWSDIRGFDI